MRMLPLLALLRFLALLVASPALADQAAVQTYRLTPEQRDAAIAAGAARPESQGLLPAPRWSADPGSHLPGGSLYAEPDRATDRRLHGEVGIVAGSGGTLGFYGSTVLPLGRHGSASIDVAVGQGQFGAFGGAFGGPFGGFGPYPGYIGPGFPLGLVPGWQGRGAAR